MAGEGPRCHAHNPTPEERDLHPERYRGGKFAGLADLKDYMKEQSV
jgi:hypothetical protein